jgi:hypothetical protein
MVRIILIDSDSGYIWGDSATLDSRVFDLDAALAICPDMDVSSVDDFALAYAEALDRSVGGEPRTYEMLSASASRDGGSGYMAYRADIDGSEAVEVVSDGQSQEAIEAVISKCREIGFIARFDKPPAFDAYEFLNASESPEGTLSNCNLHTESTDDDIAAAVDDLESHILSMDCVQLIDTYDALIRIRDIVRKRAARE